MVVATFDVGVAARRQVAQSLVEQLGQGELRGRGGDFQDRTMRAATIGGTISTRRDVPGNGDVGGAVAGPRANTETMGGERLQGEADDLRGGQPATAQREQLPEEVWRAMSLSARKQHRKDQNRKKRK